MSIFDKDIQLPIEHLYDECKDVCKYIVPRNITHYRGDKRLIKEDIIKELRYRNLFVDQFSSPDGLNNKICRVEVQLWDYIRLIPHYRVWFYYNSIKNNEIGQIHRFEQSYLTDFIVSIDGVEDKNQHKYEYI